MTKCILMEWPTHKNKIDTAYFACNQSKYALKIYYVCICMESVKTACNSDKK